MALWVLMFQADRKTCNYYVLCRPSPKFKR
jgi:hypothetical protein